MPMLLAHQGGWDEALFVAVPMAVFAVLLLRAKRQAEAEARTATPADGGDPPTATDGGEGTDPAGPAER